MSTYWGYRCETCDEDSETWFNHGDETLIKLVQHFKGYKPILDIPLVSIRVWPYDSAPIVFLEEHEGHVITLSNEYGKVLPIPPFSESEPPL